MDLDSGELEHGVILSSGRWAGSFSRVWAKRTLFGQGPMFAFWAPEFVLGSAVNANLPVRDQLLPTQVKRNKCKTRIFKQLRVLLAAYQSIL